MTDKTGGPAFPRDAAIESKGMTLRDYFAAKAMQSIIGSFRPGGWSIGVNGDHNGFISGSAYAVADAMIAAREK